jgi:signal transduction histidine kinase
VPPNGIGNRLGDVGVTSTDTRASRSERLNPRNWSLAWKLVAVGLVPALLAVVLGILRVAEQARTASELGAANRLLDVREQAAGTASALRTERDRATIFLAERRLGDRGPLTEAIASTDAAMEQLRAGVATATDLDTATRSAVEQAEGGFAQLSVLRGDIGGTSPLAPGEATQRYTSVVQRTDLLDRALLRQVRTPGVGGFTDALTAVTNASEALALQHTVLGAALRVGTVTSADRSLVNATDNAFAAAYTEYQVALPPSQTPINFLTSRANAERDADKVTILSAPAPGPISVTVQRWDDITQSAKERVDAAGAEVRTALAAAGDAAEARSSNLAGINSVILMLGLLLGATIVVLAVRSLTRSLRVLRTSALDVAERRLPQAVESMRSGGVPDVAVEPVPLPNRDEIGQVARAFDAVHGQALRLAADQAALQSNVSSMFVNLSRRSQALVERQLQLIEQLESNEQDADQLSNLFQLDHLATRMRRNSENLLVLAGTDPAKRNVAPVPLVDVLRAAVSEVEQYQRIVVQAPPPATIAGRASSDVVHLLAELLDNATNFSPPDSQVVMSSMRTPDGSMLVEIADRGVGMLEHELGDANRRLGTASSVDVSASRRMGLFVVGRLGARHGIAVHLGGAPMGGPGGGLTASVTLPAHLVVSGGDDGARATRMDGAAPVPAVPSNGVPPQRGRLDAAGSRAPLAAPMDPQSAGGPSSGVNGLPMRTPGSALRRRSASGQAEPLASEAADGIFAESGATSDGAAATDGPQSEAERHTEGDAAATEAGPTAAGDTTDDTTDGIAVDDTVDDDDADSVPTRALPVLAGASVANTGGSHEGAVDDAPADTAGSNEADATDADASGAALDDPAWADERTAAHEVADRPTTDATTDGTTDEQAGDARPATATAGHLAALQRARTEARARRAAVEGTEPDEEFVLRPAGSTAKSDEEVAAARANAAAEPSGAAEQWASDDEAELAAEQESAGQQPEYEAPDHAPAAEAAEYWDLDDRDLDRAADDHAADDETGDDQTADDQTADVQSSDAHDPDVHDPDEQPTDQQPATHAGPEPAGTARPRPRPAPRPGPEPNGTYRDAAVPPTEFEVHPDAAGAAVSGVGPNGLDQNGLDQNGAERHGWAVSPTTPLPAMPDSEPTVAMGAAGAERPPSSPLSGSEDAGADALFAPSVPSISEPDGLPRTRRPLAELRRSDPADVMESTPIFEEIASAWFAAQRPVPVDWELGKRPGAEHEPEEVASPPQSALPDPVERPVPTSPERRTQPSTQPSPEELAEEPAEEPAEDPGDDAAARFATAADEGWRAASGAALERPDELTAAGLPKRRPRARLVPGSAGSAVLAASASPTRSAESVRGRLASYQQGVRQGREIRLRRDPGSAGSQPASDGENTAASPGGGHDEDNG